MNSVYTEQSSASGIVNLLCTGYIKAGKYMGTELLNCIFILLIKCVFHFYVYTIQNLRLVFSYLGRFPKTGHVK